MAEYTKSKTIPIFDGLFFQYTLVNKRPLRTESKLTLETMKADPLLNDTIDNLSDDDLEELWNDAANACSQYKKEEMPHVWHMVDFFEYKIEQREEK